MERTRGAYPDSARTARYVAVTGSEEGARRAPTARQQGIQEHQERCQGRPGARRSTTMQDIDQCTRCGTGWLAKRVESSGHGWAVRVFVCSHCRYASQPGVLLSGRTKERCSPGSIVPSSRWPASPGPGSRPCRWRNSSYCWAWDRPRRGTRPSSIHSRVPTARWASSLSCTACDALQ